METLVDQDNSGVMDITKQIKIKTVTTEKNRGIQAMVKGIILERNPSSKHMQLHLSHPRVLTVEGSIDLDSLSSFVKFEELIKNEKAYLKKIVDKIIRVNPTIIFVEQQVHVHAL